MTQDKNDRLDLSYYTGCEPLSRELVNEALAALQAAYDEIDKLLVPMSVTEQDYRNIMKVNKGIGDMYKEAASDRDELKGILAVDMLATIKLRYERDALAVVLRKLVNTHDTAESPYLIKAYEECARMAKAALDRIKPKVDNDPKV